MKHKSDPLLGTLELYAATGETMRPQFISSDCLDELGRLKSFDGVYDLRIGDKIRFLFEPLKHESFILIYEEIYVFLSILSQIWNTENQKIEIEYVPGKNAQSWGDYARDHEKQRAILNKIMNKAKKKLKNKKV